jgi:hypothetical protein
MNSRHGHMTTLATIMKSFIYFKIYFNNSINRTHNNPINMSLLISFIPQYFLLTTKIHIFFQISFYRYKFFNSYYLHNSL